MSKDDVVVVGPEKKTMIPRAKDDDSNVRLILIENFDFLFETWTLFETWIFQKRGGGFEKGEFSKDNFDWFCSKRGHFSKRGFFKKGAGGFEKGEFSKSGCFFLWCSVVVSIFTRAHSKNR